MVDKYESIAVVLGATVATRSIFAHDVAFHPMGGHCHAVVDRPFGQEEIVADPPIIVVDHF